MVLILPNLHWKLELFILVINLTALLTNPSSSCVSVMDPPNTNTEDNESIFFFFFLFFLVLKDDDVRKTYNKTLDLGKLYQKKYVNIGFLKSCIENDVVPKSFRISNQPQNQSQQFYRRWTSAAKQASLAWIRMTISEEEKSAKEIYEKYQKSLRLLGSMIPEELHEFLAKKIEAKNEKVNGNLKKDKLRKLSHLKEQFGTGENSEVRQNMEKRNKRSRRFVKKTVWTRRQRKFRNKGVKLYFNYSKIPISPAMDRLLNRGLNYCITPNKVNVTELLVDIDKFVRKMLWQEYFHDQPDEDRKEPIVKNEKTNLPKKHKTPDKLKMFLNATASDLLDAKSRNKVHDNLPPEELEALKQLIKLQKNRVITIKTR